MIQLINAPQSNRILLDGNNTDIVVTSTNGIGYYFRAKIYIDDQLFDEQSWSRSDNFTASKDLIYLYNAYFQTVFASSFTTGLVEQTHLKRKVSITITEHLIADDSEIESLTIPEFYIVFNTKSTVFNDENKVAILGIEPEVLRMPKNGKIVVPFYINTSEEAIDITAVLDDGTNIPLENVAAQTAKTFYLYTLLLEELPLTYYHIYLTLKITVGETVIEQDYKLMRNTHFQVKELVFQNNFGYYIPVYFDGEFSTSNGYKVETYTQYDSSDIIYNIATDAQYTINTNGLLTNEKAITDQVAQSLDCKFLQGTNYISLNTTTAKVKDFTDKQHQYNTKLTFEFKTNLDLDNLGFLETPNLSDIEINGIQDEETNIATSVFEAAFAPYVLNEIVFSDLPTTGVLYAEIGASFVQVSINTIYDFTTITSFKFVVNTAHAFGTPFTEFGFKARDTQLFSEVANVVVNIAELVDSDIPPYILVPAYTTFFQVVEGSGSLDVEAIVTAGGAAIDTILWQFVGASYSGVTLSNDTTATVTLTAAAAILGTFQISITVTDVNGLMTTRTVSIQLTESVLVIDSTLVPLLDVGTETQSLYDILITDGIENETVEVEFIYDVFSNNRYALIDYQSHLESAVTLSARKKSNVYTFDASGEVSFQVFMEDYSETEHQTMTLEIKNPSGSMAISKFVNKVIL